MLATAMLRYIGSIVLGITTYISATYRRQRVEDVLCGGFGWTYLCLTSASIIPWASLGIVTGAASHRTMINVCGGWVQHCSWDV